MRTRREVAFPNPGFTEQLQRFQHSPATVELRARVRAAFPHDVALVEADMAEIRAAMEEQRARVAAGERPFDPRERILQAMQEMQEQVDADGNGDDEEEEDEADEDEEDEDGDGDGKEGDGKAKKRGDDNGGWGLTWVEEECAHHSRTDELPR